MSTEAAGTRVLLHLRQTYLLSAGYTLEADVVLEVGGAYARLFRDDGKEYLEVSRQRPVDAAIIRDLELLQAGKAPEGTDRTHPMIVHRDEWDGSPLIDVQGNVRGRHVLPVGSLRAPLRDEIRAMQVALHETAVSVARALRWRLAAGGPHPPLGGSKGPEWSTDGAAWKRLPSDISARIRAISHPRVGSQARIDVERLATTGPTEPIAHELLREAEDNAGRNSRSSLVLAVAAIETGIKAYVSDVAPAAGWLAFEAPSPPVLKMLCDYLPSLPTPKGGRIGKPPRRIRALVSAAVDARNKVAHKGRSEGAFERLDELLDTARDLLYALDYFRGQAWAAEHLNDQAKKDWGLSTP
jgi:hypothetical protein